MFYADHYCRYEENHELVSPYHTYTFIGKWRDSGKQHKVTVEAPDLFRYRQGELIQNAFPYLNNQSGFRGVRRKDNPPPSTL